VSPHCLKQGRPRGYAPPALNCFHGPVTLILQRDRRHPRRHCHLLIPVLPGGQDRLPMGEYHPVKVRGGQPKRTCTQPPLFQPTYVASRHRCRRHRPRFPGQHLMSRWPRLLYPPFLLFSPHSCFPNTVCRNHHLQVTYQSLKYSWHLLPPINSSLKQIHLLIPDFFGFASRDN
jgi:hypothetical protein